MDEEHRTASKRVWPPPRETPFALWLRGRMAERGLTQTEVAARAGLGQPTVARWASGRAAPSAASLPKVAAALGVPVEEALAAAGVRPDEADDPPATAALVADLRRLRLTDDREAALRALLGAWPEADGGRREGEGCA